LLLPGCGACLFFCSSGIPSLFSGCYPPVPPARHSLFAFNPSRCCRVLRFYRLFPLSFPGALPSSTSYRFYHGMMFCPTRVFICGCSLVASCSFLPPQRKLVLCLTLLVSDVFSLNLISCHLFKHVYFPSFVPDQTICPCYPSKNSF